MYTGLDLKNEKRFAILVKWRHTGKIIRNCESFFTTYSHYCTMYINASKNGEILPKKGVQTKKKVFGRYHLKSDSQSTKSDLQFGDSLCQSDSQLPQK